MLSDDFDYLNFDNPEHRLALMDRSWDRSRQLIIFDELHKLKNWKSWLKGSYDTEKTPPWIIVTGSAKLDYLSQGRRLTGRPLLSVPAPSAPISKKSGQPWRRPISEAALAKLLEVGGFPEPYLEGETRFYNRWKRSHLDIILKQDLIDLENVQQITAVETLIQLLRKRVGRPGVVQRSGERSAVLRQDGQALADHP